MTITVYFDHNATSPLRPKVKDAVIAALDLAGNPSSVHHLGRQSRRAVEDARHQVRIAVNAPKTAQVIFTSGGTEANTLALNGTDAVRILVGATEHASVLAAHGDIELIPVDANGRVDLGHLQSMLASGDGRALVSVMMANNETGALQHIEDIAHLAHRFGARVHSDAVQALGKVEVDFVALGVDLLSLSAHKIGGPLGVGALIAAQDISLTPFNRGGGQEGGLRGGTENVSGVVGFGIAAQQAVAELEDMRRIKALRTQLESGIKEIARDAIVFAESVDRLPNTSFFTLPGVPSETQVMAFDLAGICVSSGSACGSGKSKLSAVLAAMKVPEDIAKTALRVSLGHDNTAQEIESFLSVYKDLYVQQMQKSNAA
jgi:cysteine desulfurase